LITAGCDFLENTLERIMVSECIGSGELFLSLENVKLDVHVYGLLQQVGSTLLQIGNETDSTENSPNARVFELPSEALDGLWESYVFLSIKLAPLLIMGQVGI
jgi:hypothetical protein